MRAAPLDHFAAAGLEQKKLRTGLHSPGMLEKKYPQAPRFTARESRMDVSRLYNGHHWWISWNGVRLMRFALLLLALSTATRADPLKPFCSYGDKACFTKLEARARDCLEVESLQIGLARVRWIRCEAPVPENGDLPMPPPSFVLVSGPSGGVAYVLGDEDTIDSDSELYSVERVTGRRLFIVANVRGSGGMEDWALLDLGSLPFRQLGLPRGFDAKVMALLHRNERLGYGGWEVFMKGATLVAEAVIQQLDDPAVANRGEVHATLVVRGRRLVLQRIKRVPPPP